MVSLCLSEFLKSQGASKRISSRTGISQILASRTIGSNMIHFPYWSFPEWSTAYLTYLTTEMQGHCRYCKGIVAFILIYHLIILNQSIILSPYAEEDRHEFVANWLFLAVCDWSCNLTLLSLFFFLIHKMGSKNVFQRMIFNDKDKKYNLC